MACSQTLSNLLDGCDLSVGGILEAYYANFADVTAKTLTSDVITTISMASSTKFYTLHPPRQTSGLTSTWNISDENGTKYVQTDLQLVFNKMETAKRAAVMALALGEFCIIVKDRNGKYWFLGDEEPVKISAGDLTTGTARSDRNGYTVTLTDVSSAIPYEVDGSIVEALLA